MPSEYNSIEKRRHANIKRLPVFIQDKLKNKEEGHLFLTLMKLNGCLIVAGISPTPGYGMAQHKASIELVRYALGEIDIDDTRFEYLMRIMTPPEYLQ